MKTLVLGIGNTILGDDGVGVRVVNEAADAVRGSWPPDVDITFKDTAAAGLNLMDDILGYERLVVVDAILAGDENIGKIYRLTLKDLAQTPPSIALHSCGLAATLELGYTLFQDQVPRDVIVFGVGIHSVEKVTEEMNQAIQAAVPEMVKMLILELMPAEPTELSPPNS
jgi:hydrogenase maturation protease